MNADSDDEAEWPREAIMHMKLSGGGEGKKEARAAEKNSVRKDEGAERDAGRGGWNGYDGRGYGHAI